MIVTDEGTVLSAVIKIREVQAILLDVWARHPQDDQVKKAAEGLQEAADLLQKDE